MANGVDPNQMPHSDLALHYLLMPICLNTHVKMVHRGQANQSNARLTVKTVSGDILKHFF